MVKEYAGFKLTDIKRGQAWEPRGKYPSVTRLLYRVMGVIDGYVVYRAKGCQPGIRFWKDFLVEHRRMPSFDSSAE